jgi:hypothetical protein
VPIRPTIDWELCSENARLFLRLGRVLCTHVASIRLDRSGTTGDNGLPFGKIEPWLERRDDYTGWGI